MEQFQIRKKTLVIRMPRELDHHSAEQIRLTADQMIARKNVNQVEFDFRDTDFMDSSGIGVIMGRYKRVYLLGGEVFAVHTNERMKRILSMSGVTKIMQIYEEDL